MRAMNTSLEGERGQAKHELALHGFLAEAT
jgi:hypothetical protein